MRQRHTHWHTQRTNNNLHGAERIEDGGRLAPVFNQPVVRLERQSEAEEVLEDDHACESLDGEVACRNLCISNNSLCPGGPEPKEKLEGWKWQVVETHDKHQRCRDYSPQHR